MRRTLLIIGIVLILLGAVWSLQGLGVLLGSPMTGSSFWATAGLALIAGGIVLLVLGWRRRTE